MTEPTEEPTGPAGWSVRPFLAPLTDQSAGLPGDRPAGDQPAESGPGVRPFVLTGGRVAAASDLAVETQVVRTSRGRDAVDTLSLEYRDIVLLCEEPLAVAEIAATLHLQLGVARVLVSDLTHQGMVTTSEPEAGLTDDVDTIMRVIHGLRERS